MPRSSSLQGQELQQGRPVLVQQALLAPALKALLHCQSSRRHQTHRPRRNHLQRTPHACYLRWL